MLQPNAIRSAIALSSSVAALLLTLSLSFCSRSFEAHGIADSDRTLPGAGGHQMPGRGWTAWRSCLQGVTAASRP